MLSSPPFSLLVQMLLPSALAPLFLSTVVLAFNQPRQSSSVTGDAFCSPLVCISATLNGTLVQYVMQSTGSSTLGWIAIGFGTTMANSDMVIMWPNSDSSITLSQRTATGEVMPTVDSTPTRIASILAYASDIVGIQPKLAFSVPATTDTTQPIIWAYSTVNPGSAAVDAPIAQHIDVGTYTFNLTSPLAIINGTSDTIASSPAISVLPSGTVEIVPAKYKRIIIGHAILSTIGFLLLLPLGALVGRYLRTLTGAWFKAHWIIQAAIAGPVILTGFILGLIAVYYERSLHLNDTHKKWGLITFCIYVLQCIFGYVIHTFKPRSATKRRPIQNYLHAIVGLFTIGLAMFQVRTGYRDEWPSATGSGSMPRGVDVAWVACIVLIPAAYFVGMALLPKQYAQEKAARAPSHGISLGDAPPIFEPPVFKEPKHSKESEDSKESQAEEEPWSGDVLMSIDRVVF